MVSSFGKNCNCKILDTYNLFSSVLNNTFEFIDAYLDVCPKQRVRMLVSAVTEKANNSLTTCYYDTFVKIDITVDYWRDGIIFLNREAKNFIGLYTFNPKDNTFTYKILIGESQKDCIPKDVIDSVFFEWIDRYERNNPNRKLTRTPYGVHNQWN